MTPEYLNFVHSRAKPGAAILDTLIPEKCHLLHMAVGISGEAAEFLQAYGNDDQKNIREELGDILFYAVGVTLVIPWTYGHYAKAFQTTPFPHMGYVNSLVVAAGNFLDTVKKYTMYNKPYDSAKLIEDLLVVIACVVEYCENYEIDVKALIQENMDKLTARYPLGYSDKAALARADKEVSGA